MEVTTLSVQVKSDGIDQATKSLDALGSQAERTEKSVGKLTEKLANTSATFAAIKASLNEMKAVMALSFPTDGANALNKAMMELSSTLATIKGKNIKVDVGAKDLGSDAAVARKGVESLNQSLASGQNVMQMFGKELYHIRNLLGGTMLAGALQNATGSLIQMADGWALMQAKLKMALGSMQAANSMQEKLFTTATNLRVPMEGVTTLFVRLVPAMKEYGYSANDALKVTTAMSAALKISGATAAEASSVMLQFSQAMQAGRLNGAEFNAVAEGAPIILRAIAAETGKTRGQLKQMGADGELSVELITKSLLKWQPVWEKMAKDMPMTMEAAVSNLVTSLTRFIGIANESLGVTQTLAKGIDWLAKNIDILGKILGIVAAGALAGFATSLVLSAFAAASNAATMVSLAAAISGVGVVSAGSTVAVGFLSAALKTLNVNPIILAVTALVAAGAAIYAFAEKSLNPLKNVYDNIDKINEAHPDSKGKFKAFTEEIEKLDVKIADGYKNYERLKQQQEKTFDPKEAEVLTGQLKVQAKAISQLEEAQKLYQQQIAQTGVVASDAHTKFMKEHNDKMQVLGIEGNLRRNLSTTEISLLEKVNAFRAESEQNPQGSKRLEELRTEMLALGRRVGEEKRVADAIKQTKDVQKSGESFDKKYDKEIEKIDLFIAKQNEELNIRTKLTEAQSMSVKISEFINNNSDKLSASRRSELLSLQDSVLTKGIEIQQNKDLIKTQELLQDRYYKEQDAILAASEATRLTNQEMQRKMELLDMAKSGVQETAVGEQLYTIEQNKSALAAVNGAIAIREKSMALAELRLATASSPEEQALAQKEISMLKEKLLALNAQAAALSNLIPQQKKQLEALTELSKITMLDIGRSPGQILADGFGEAGAAISKMTAAYSKFGDEATKINKYVADKQAALMSQGMGKEDARIAAEQDVADKRVQIAVSTYADMAGAAKGFFSENSKGYQAMAKAEKAFRVIELALAAKSFIQKMFFTTTETGAAVAGAITKGTAETTLTSVSVGESLIRTAVKAKEAVVGAFVGVGPTGFVTGAAMIAILAALGFAMSGGGGASPTLSADRQAAQGTGTVFGDSGAKSESTTKALELVAKNSEIALTYNAGMLASLKNIENALTGVAKLVIRGGVQGQLSSATGMGTTTDSSMNKAFGIGSKSASMNMATLGLGSIINSVGKALFSVKKSVVDSGLMQNAQALADIASSGLAVKGYTDIETKTKKVRTKTKIDTVYSAVSAELQDQLTKVVLGLGDSITQAAKALKLDGDSFTSTLDSFVVDIGRISIQGMDAKQIQETLTNVFSKLGDEMASAVMPGLTQFQGAGEGYMETLIRVASTVATVDGIFAEVGTTFGTTGMDAIKAKMDLVELAGGIQELSSMVGNFFDKFYTEAEKKAVAVNNITTKMADLGVQGFDPLAENARVVFRSMVENAKETNPELMVELLKLSDAVDSVAPAFKKAASAAEIAEKALSQQDEYNKLTMSSSEYLAYARGKELEAMDESLRPMQKRIYALQDEAKITEQKTTLEDTYNKLALSGTALLTYNRNLELAKMDESLRPLQMRIYALQDEKTALEDMKKGASGALAILDKSVVAQKKILKDDLDGKILNINSAKDAEDTRFEAEKAKLEATKTISDEYYATQQEAAANAVTSIKEYRDELKTLFDDISGAVDKLTNNNKQLQAISYSAAKAQLDSVLATAKSSGQLPDSKSFKDVLDSLTSLSESDFSTMLDFQREQLVSAGKLSQLGGVAGGKLSAAESAVLAAEANVKATKDAAKEAADRYTEETKSLEDKHKVTTAYYDSNIKALQTQYDLDVEFYDKLLQNAKDQIDIANGTYIATIGVRDAVDYFGTALGMYIAAKDADQARLVDQVNQMGLKTTGYEDALAKQESDKQAIVTEMAGLREDLAAQNKAIATNTLATAKVLQRWDGDGQPEVRNVA